MYGSGVISERLWYGLTTIRPESHPIRRSPHMNGKLTLCSRARARKDRIRPNMDSARIAADPEEPAHQSEADPIQSCPTREGQVRIRCRFRKDRIRPHIDSARIASDPEELAYQSKADSMQSCPTHKDQVWIRCHFRQGRIRPNIVSARIASDPEEPSYHSVAGS